MADFNNFVFNTASQNPPSLIYSLSASNNSFILSNGGTVGSKTVVGILYNQITAGTANVSLSCGLGTTFRVASGYHGAQAALYFSDRSSTLFTVNTTFALTTQQTVDSANTFDNRGPNERRLSNLNG
jgi:hypothetical protein